MAIDSSMFGVALPAGTYTQGDVLSLSNIRGPAIVRDGYGAAYLKRIFTMETSAASTAKIVGHVVIKNSNWVDSVSNIISPPEMISLAETSSNLQRGHDALLTSNSGWDVSFVVDATVTTTTDADIIALIDVDYPSVQAVQNPREAKGAPVTIMRSDSVNVNAYGTVESAAWNTYNVDFLKAGYKYLLVEAGGYLSTAAVTFVSLSGAAGQNGLERIIPITTPNLSRMRYLLDYSTPIVKGPMNINYLAFGTAGTATILTELDWVKRT